MSEYGIDGAVVQRFIADIRVFRHMRDQVLKNVQASSERYGRVFANMYDITGLEPSPSILEDIMNDWKHLVDGLKITESPRYLRSNNLPVLGVYFGKASETPLTAKETSTLIDWLQNNPEERYRATVIGAGLGKDWRTMSSSDWRAVYQKLDVISPGPSAYMATRPPMINTTKSSKLPMLSSATITNRNTFRLCTLDFLRSKSWMANQ